MEAKTVIRLISLTISIATLLVSHFADGNEEATEQVLQDDYIVQQIEESSEERPREAAKPAHGIGQQMPETESQSNAEPGVGIGRKIPENKDREVIEEQTYNNGESVLDDEERAQLEAAKLKLGMFEKISPETMNVFGLGGPETIIAEHNVATHTIVLESGDVFQYEVGGWGPANYTTYCTCRKCCSAGLETTLSGLYLGDKENPKVVAASEQYPIGTVLFVPGWGLVTVEDRGSAVSGNTIDRFVTDHDVTAYELDNTYVSDQEAVRGHEVAWLIGRQDKGEVFVLEWGDWDYVIPDGTITREEQLSEWALSINP